jgi:glycosyltransferase involved in cell wall biosynthesis
MDIFALPSLYEGFAYVLIEALHAGLPIISTPVGGSQESIVPGENGLIVPHGSPALMAAAVRQLVSDPELRRAMARASAMRASRFSIAGMVDTIESLYRGKAVDAGQSGSPLPAVASIGVAG